MRGAAYAVEDKVPPSGCLAKLWVSDSSDVHHAHKCDSHENENQLASQQHKGHRHDTCIDGWLPRSS
jgi:hypothetical protein